MNIKILILIALSVVIYTSQTLAQVAILSTGGDIIGSGGSISYSIGQLVYDIDEGQNETVSKGVQQPYVGYNVIDLNQVSSVAYPNPTFDLLTLEIHQLNVEELAYSLFDMQGTQIYHKNLKEQTTTIILKNLPKSIYLLNIENHNKIVKTFRIIKN